jgi:hypothetical protein
MPSICRSCSRAATAPLSHTIQSARPPRSGYRRRRRRRRPLISSVRGHPRLRYVRSLNSVAKRIRISMFSCDIAYPARSRVVDSSESTRPGSRTSAFGAKRASALQPSSRPLQTRCDSTGAGSAVYCFAMGKAEVSAQLNRATGFRPTQQSRRSSPTRSHFVAKHSCRAIAYLGFTPGTSTELLLGQTRRLQRRYACASMKAAMPAPTMPAPREGSARLAPVRCLDRDLDALVLNRDDGHDHALDVPVVLGSERVLVADAKRAVRHESRDRDPPHLFDPDLAD